MIPVAIPTPGGTCFAAYHPAAGPAVLVCPPFGHEALTTARVWRCLALRLAARGIAALRFDLPGSGDSAGAPEDTGRIAAWRAAVRACAAWLASRHGGRISLFGHRFGAMLALDAAAQGVAAERLVLLDPPASGAAFARGLRARARLEGFGAPPEGSDFIQAWGVPLSAETLAGLAALPASLDAGGAALPPTLLVLEDAPGAGASDWPARLRGAGAAVAIAPFEGYADFVPLEGLDAVPPAKVLARVADFLAPEDGADIATGPVSPLPALAGVAMPCFREVPVRFGPGDGLFGLFCRPEHASRATPAVLMPSVAALPRSGYARMWTELARRLAVQGVASFRFDMPGVGESGGEEASDRLAAAYHPGRVADLRAALDALEAQGHRGALVVGHCSGAYTALQAAAADRRIVGLLASNPQFLVLQTVLSRAALERRPGAGASACGPPAEAPPAGGRVRRSAVLRGIDELSRRAFLRPLRELLRSLGAEERQARRHLRRLLGDGCAVRFVFAEDDAGHFRLRRAFGEAPRLPPGATLALVEGADHNFNARRHRARFLDLAVAFVLEAAEAPAPPPPVLEHAA